MDCIFCSNNSFKQYSFPKIEFNNKLFLYQKCKNCNLIQLNPLPNEDDYNEMYKPDYQNNEVDTNELDDLNKPLSGLRFSYKEQFDIIRKNVGKNPSILDYGCGNGNFIYNAYQNGFENVFGAEFNENYVQKLSTEMPNVKFYTIEDLLDNKENEKYDVIRLSNVLEHLNNPNEVIGKLKKKLNNNGIFIVEGPIEANFYPMNIINKLYFNLTSNRTLNIAPYHIFFSNYKNQRDFFKTFGLEEMLYRTKEISWPYPDRITFNSGIKTFVVSVLSYISRCISNTFSTTWGNTFIYVGINNE